MGITRLAAYAVVAALSFGGGYAAHYYQQNKDTNYTIGVTRDNFGIKKNEGIEQRVDNTADEARKRFNKKRKDAADFFHDIGEKVDPD
ncbi:hypothetical protein COV19_06195 [Candidatus Woesearchaeota archaeon CG10_big_fil_rev_8_21_14_0_10_44_13]|nr:MAG: hypothetical protein COV19_06195 [Candidatus Woesearchaeota archaeon CG10_big_fil_rev_8_21_14_0_10_44_13]